MAQAPINNKSGKVRSFKTFRERSVPMIVRRHFAIFAILLLALVLRVPFVDRCPWVDETFSLCVSMGHSLEGRFEKSSDYADRPGPVAAREYLGHLQPTGSVADVVSAVTRSDTSPPLHYLLLRGWFGIFGASAAAGRVLSILFGLAVVVTLYHLGRQINVETGIVAALLASCSTIQITTVTETRMYGLLTLCACLSLGVTYSLVKNRGRSTRSWIAWTFVNLAGLYAHYVFIGMFLTVNLYLAIEWARRRRPPLRFWLSAALLCGGLFLVWLPAVMAQFDGVRTTSGWLAGDMSVIEIVRWGARTTGGLVFGFHWNRIVSAILLIVVGLGVARAWRRRGASAGLLLLLGFVVPVGFIMGLDWIRATRQVTVPRYLLPAAPAMYLALASAVGFVSRWARVVVVAALCGILVVGGIWQMTVREPQWQPFDVVGRYLSDHVAPNDLVVIRSIPSGVVATCGHLDPDLMVGAMTRDLDESSCRSRVQRLLAERTGNGSVWLVVAHTSWSQSFQEDAAWIIDALRDEFHLAEERSFGRRYGAIELYRFAPAAARSDEDQERLTPDSIPRP